MSLGVPVMRLVEGARTLAHNEVLTDIGGGLVRANTKPNVGLYPFQWNWDSAITAMGFGALGDGRRALAELQSLHSAQAADGFLAHIAYSDEAAAKYFPKSSDWATQYVGADGRRISGITQPPVSGVALKYLADHELVDVSSPEVRALIRRVHEHHEWWMRGSGANPRLDGDVVVGNGWSTGRDNGPEVIRMYRDPGSVVDPSAPAKRQDLKHGVDPASRPDDWYYERAMGTNLDAAAHGGWDAPGVLGKLHFQLVDPAIASLLGASVRDIAALARRAGGMDDVVERSGGFVDQLAGAQARRTAANGTVFARNGRTGELLRDDLTIASVMAAWMPRAEDRVVLRVAELIRDGGELAGTQGGVLTTARSSELFDPQRYWQGPTWAHMDELAAVGLLRAADEPGRDPEVARIARDAVRQLDARAAAAYGRHGSPEYLHAESGDVAGKRGMSFSTAAMLMFARRHGQGDGLAAAHDAYSGASVWRPDARTTLVGGMSHNASHDT